MRGIAKLMMLAAALGMLLAGATAAFALDKSEAQTKVEESVIVVKKMVSSPDAKAARWLLKRSKGVIIVPDMVKAGLVLGGKFGRGILLARTKNGSWSPPVFLTLGGVSAGFQLGAQTTELFMVLMNRKGIDGVLKGKAKFGVDAAVTGGPWGRDAAAGLNAASLKADIYSYSRSQGLYGGATLDGAGMEIDKETTKAYYGKAIPASQILAGKAVPGQEAKRLIAVLEKYANMK